MIETILSRLARRIHIWWIFRKRQRTNIEGPGQMMWIMGRWYVITMIESDRRLGEASLVTVRGQDPMSYYDRHWIKRSDLRG